MALAQTKPSDEVRRCADCGQPALIVVHAWQHSVNGMSTHTVTRDCQCQSCGATVTLHPRGKIIAMWIVAALLSPAIIPGLIFGGIAFRRGRAWKNHPIVEGAVRPERRYRNGPAPRRCECGGVAFLTNITRRTHNGIPAGTEMQFKCEKCQNSFTTESIGGLMATFFAGALLAGGGLLIFFESKTPLTRWGWGLGLTALGLLVFGGIVKRISAAVRHPELPSTLL